MFCSIKDNSPEEQTHHFELTPENMASLRQPFHMRLVNCFFSNRTGYHLFENEQDLVGISSSSAGPSTNPIENEQTLILYVGADKNYSIMLLENGQQIRVLHDPKKIVDKNRPDGLPFTKTYCSRGLHIHLGDETNKLIFDFRNNYNFTGRGWEVFIEQKIKLRLDRLALRGKIDVDEMIRMIESVLIQTGVTFIPIVDITLVTKVDPLSFNDFLVRYKVDSLRYDPMTEDLLNQPYLKKLNTHVCGGRGLPLKEFWLQEARLKQLIIINKEPRIYAGEIRCLLTHWLQKKVNFECYELEVIFTNVRDLWPIVPVRQIRRYDLRNGSNYILKLFFGSENKVKLIRNDDKEMYIIANGTRVTLQLQK